MYRVVTRDKVPDDEPELFGEHYNAMLLCWSEASRSRTLSVVMSNASVDLMCFIATTDVCWMGA